MIVRTRRRERKRKPDGNIYNLSRWMNPQYTGPKGLVGTDGNGKQILESLPSLLYYPAIHPNGHIVNVTVHTDPNVRDHDNQHAQRTRLHREDWGFIMAHECPIRSRILHEEDEAHLFGPDVKACREHDFQWRPGEKYRPVNLCPHLAKIREVRIEAKQRHAEQLQARFGGKKRTQNEMLALLTEIAEQGRAPSPARTSGEVKGKSK